jgi:hypothetical protein
MEHLIFFLCFAIAFILVVFTNRRRLWERQDTYRNARVLPNVSLYKFARNRYFLFVVALTIAVCIMEFILECIVFHFFPTI